MRRSRRGEEPPRPEGADIPTASCHRMRGSRRHSNSRSSPPPGFPYCEPMSTAAPRMQFTSFQLSDRIEPVGAWLFGFLLVGLLAGHSGGFFPEAWAWAAFSTWLLAACVVACRPRIALGALDLTMIGGTLAFGGWFALSALWSRSVPSTLDESIRYLAYAGIVVAALVVVERWTVPHLLGGVTAAISLLSLHALGTRVLPDRLGESSPILGYRLAGTIGYWNGLGIFAVIGLFLALGFAARGERLATRAAAAGALPVLAVTMYFTFSRGAWLALLAGFVAALVVDARRLQLAFASAVLGVLPAVGILLASFASGARGGHRHRAGTRSPGCSLCGCGYVALACRTAYPRAAIPPARLGGGVGHRASRWHRGSLDAGGVAGVYRAACVGQGARVSAVHGHQRTAPRPVVERPLRSLADSLGHLLRAPDCRCRWRHLLAGVGGEFARLFRVDRGARRLPGDASRARDHRARPAVLRPRAASDWCGAREALAARFVRVRSVCGLGRACGCRLGLGADGSERRRAGLRRGARRGRSRRSACSRSRGARRRARNRGIADAAVDDQCARECASRRRSRLRFGGAISSVQRRMPAAHDGSLPGRHRRSR